AYAALHEGVGGAPGAGVEHGYVLEQLADEVLGCGFVATAFFEGVAPGRQVVPARAAGGRGVWRDDFDTGLDQVLPIDDALGVAFAHQEHDGRGVGSTVVVETALPVLGDFSRQPGDLVDVVGQRKGDHVGLQAIDHRARLFAGAAV